MEIVGIIDRLNICINWGTNMSTERKVLKTTNAALQRQLDSWVSAIEKCFEGGTVNHDAVRSFTATFVPSDVSADDIEFFSNNLINDEEYFLSVRRDVGQCASGNYVDSITGNQRKKAVFTLLPLPELGLDPGALDIVREVAYISTDGVTWTAEG